jgi:hypothetical protein
VTTRVGDERGMVGKLIVIWLLLVVALGIAAIDGASILFTRVGLSDTATGAAGAAAADLQRGQTATQVCAVAADTVAEEDPGARMSRRNGCRVDTATGAVTIALRKRASTLVAGRLPFTQDATLVTVRETVGRSSL